jgi:hypothetical protein
MFNRRELLGSGAVTAAGLILVPRLALAQQPPFVSLYNGNDLTGWHVKDGKEDAWAAEGEVIACVKGGGGWLTSDREYGDFVLRIDYRITKGGNSGIGIRYPREGDPAHMGMEIQIIDEEDERYKGKLKPEQVTGGIYYQAAPTEHPARPPGEWNTYSIRCQGPRIRVRLNRVTIHDINVEEFTEGKGGYPPLAKRPRSGHIGMQSYDSRVEFRNIRLRELT